MKTEYQHEIIEEELIKSKKELGSYYFSGLTKEQERKLERIRALEIHLEIAKKSFEEGKRFSKKGVKK
jgi:hypothetical protein